MGCVIGAVAKVGYVDAASPRQSRRGLFDNISPFPASRPTSGGAAPFGAFAPTRAQAAIIALAHRARLTRGAFRPMLSRLVNLLRAGPLDVQLPGRVVSLYHQASATERGALFIPTTISRSWIFCAPIGPWRRVRRCRRQCRHLALALARQVGGDRQSDCDRAASRHPCAARVQPRHVRLHPGRPRSRGSRPLPTASS